MSVGGIAPPSWGGGPLGSPGPAQAGMLIHFCGRPPGTGQSWALDPVIAAMQPWERLANILWEQRIRGSAVFGGTRPAVCFTEAAPPHLAWLLTQRGFPAWGLVFSRQGLYDRGAGPVWYARPEAYAQVAGTPAAEWAVRFDTTPASRSDWMHEQEWRMLTHEMPVGGGPELLGVLVDDPQWSPARFTTEWTGTYLSEDGTPTTDLTPHPELRTQWWVPNLWRGRLRLWLDRQTGQIVPLGPLE